MLMFRYLPNVWKERFAVGDVTTSFVPNSDMSSIDAKALMLKPVVNVTIVVTVVVVTVEIMADNRYLFRCH